MSCRGKLAKLDEKLTLMEQRVEYIEARVLSQSAKLNHIEHGQTTIVTSVIIFCVLQVTKGEALS